ncbi:MAG: hypothetical protein EOM91_15140 [Sphingobacteriia bacterium]|nr:hypothetical protein [Sphingobacteriia bacterium]NCC40661.1 hypothetical protein [Gammaproteobacteria bacterium]
MKPSGYTGPSPSIKRTPRSALPLSSGEAPEETCPNCGGNKRRLMACAHCGFIKPYVDRSREYRSERPAPEAEWSRSPRAHESTSRSPSWRDERVTDEQPRANGRPSVLVRVKRRRLVLPETESATDSESESTTASATEAVTDDR